MRISQILKRAFIPRLCVFCKEVIDYDLDEPICEECMIDWLENLDMMCSKCGFDSDYCTCLPDRIREINNSIATFGVFYTPSMSTPVNRLVYRLKRDYNFEVIRLCASIMYKKAIKLCAKHSIKFRSYIVTFPPRRKKSVIKYGYDHAQRLAKEFAKKMKIKMIPCLKNVGKKEQKKLDKSERFFNASTSYEMLEGVDVEGKKIFIVDDVMTSGATINSCARILKENGAIDVIPITFAKDMIPMTADFNEK